MKIEEKEVELIEIAIKELDYPTFDELFESIKGKISKRKLEGIIDILLLNHHILMDKGKIVWVWNPKVADRIFSNKEILIK